MYTHKNVSDAPSQLESQVEVRTLPQVDWCAHCGVQKQVHDPECWQNLGRLETSQMQAQLRLNAGNSSSRLHEGSILALLPGRFFGVPGYHRV